MATNFIDGQTVVTAAWLNSVDAAVNQTGTGAGAALIPYTSSGTGAVATTVAAKLSQYLSVADFGASGTGTDESAKIQSAMNAASGKTLYFPKPTSSYNIASNITMPSPPVNIVMDPNAVFSGAGVMPGAITNTAQKLNQSNYTYQAFTGGTAGVGNQSSAIETNLTSSYVGNGVAVYAGAQCPSGSWAGFGWSLNTLISLNHSSGGGNGIGYELDLNNFGQNGIGTGQLITGVGTFNPQTGLSITRATTGSDWQYGQTINRFQVGLQIDGSNSSAPTFGLVVQNLPSNLVRFSPSNDTTPSASILYLTNAAQSQVNFQITKRGGVQIGNAGTEILKHLSVSVVLPTFGAVAANSTAEQSVTVTGSNPGDSCVASPNGVLAGGIVWSAYCAVAGTVKIRVANVTTSAVNPDGGGGSTWRVDVWQH